MPEPATTILSENALPKFAEVALALPLRQTFTYSLPVTIAENLQMGARVLVPFGSREMTGYVVAVHQNLPNDIDVEEGSIRNAVELLDTEPLLTEEILRLTQWTADYYASSWGEVLKASLPAGINANIEQLVTITENGKYELLKLTSPRLKTIKAQILGYLNETAEASLSDLTKQFGAAAKRAVREMAKQKWVNTFQRALTIQTKAKLRKAVRLLDANQQKEGAKPLTDAQARVIEILISEDNEIGYTELIEKADVSSSVINTLEKRGVLQIFVREIRRDPLSGVKIPEIKDIVLTPEQDEVFNEITGALDAKEYKAFLLHGVTGSGKTEIYIRAMRATLNHSKTALMLVPEIALTPVFSKRLRSIFGDEVAILHSSLSPGERFDEWRRLRSGKARVAIGTRSAVFAPLQDIGLLIIDEEHDASYRQHESPYYHARDVAIMRANMAKAVVVLGSATPAIESFYNAQNGKYKYLHLPNRIGNRPMAKAELIDMREVFQQEKKDKLISSQLLEAIEETYSRGEQSIILLNRRGFSSFVLCRSCGESIRCKNCDITLTFHKRDNALICHYCGFRGRVPHKCPLCESKYIYFVGEGTEQLEDILKRKFSEMRIARVDRDTTRRRRSFEETLMDFSEHKIDMLVGTQMLAKGHDYPNVTLVGVISVDIGLALPDFRSAERTFQLLAQVAGRAGRGDLPGKVLIQTFHPYHYALQHACTQNYENFYNEEIAFRKKLNYPPFVALAAILVQHESHDYAFDNALLLKECLEAANTERNARIVGPAPAPLSRLKGKHRLQILIRAVNRKKLRELIDFALADAQAKMCDLRIVNIEIDPLNLL